MTRRVGGALLALTIVAACAAPSDDRAAEGAEPRCADLTVLGVRGSGQAADRNQGVGKEVLRTVTDLARRVERRGTSLRLEAVPYDASGTATSATYFEHVRAGARLAERQADDVLRRCPESRLALVGFSQGANVVHEFAGDVSSVLADRIVLIGMIADPRRNPADAITQFSYGDATPPRPGLLGPGAPVDEDVRSASIGFCTEGDEVCNGGGIVGERTSPTHRFFYERHATAAATAAELDRILQANSA